MTNPKELREAIADIEKWLGTQRILWPDGVRAAVEFAEKIEAQRNDLFEVLKLALACEPDDWRMWHPSAQSAVERVVASLESQPTATLPAKGG